MPIAPNATRITVVIPARNEETRLHTSLIALKKQSFQNFTVIVVDNNSTDSTAEIAQQYGAKVVYEKTAGYSFAYNKGLSSANTELIAVTDADSQPDPEWLAKIVETFDDNAIVGITGGIRVKDKIRLLARSMEIMYASFIMLNFLIGKPHLTGFNMAFRKSALEKVNYMNNSFTMSPEVDLGLRIAAVGKVKFVPTMRVTTSTRRWDKNIFSTLIHYGRGYLFAIWLRKPPYGSVKD